VNEIRDIIAPSMNINVIKNVNEKYNQEDSYGALGTIFSLLEKEQGHNIDLLWRFRSRKVRQCILLSEY